MIRRLNRRRSPLTIDQYVHRATLGLPRAERLDAATELRAHLLERVAEYQASGYAREEAEFLAVRGMGEVRAIQREWGDYALVRRAGWVLVAALIGGASTLQFMQNRNSSPIIYDDPLLVNSFSNGGILPTFYQSYKFKTPPQTRFIELAWIGTHATQRAILPSSAQTDGKVFFSWPTWRDWWKERTPLPMADLPWRNTCHDQQPVHVGLEVSVSEQAYRVWQAGERPQSSETQKDAAGQLTNISLSLPNSNLRGVLWCSGLTPPPTAQNSLSSTRGGSSSKSAAVNGGTVEVQQSDGQKDGSRLRLNHWTLLSVFVQDDRTTYKTGEQHIQGEAALFIRASDNDDPAPLPQMHYDRQQDSWDIREQPSQTAKGS